MTTPTINIIYPYAFGSPSTNIIYPIGAPGELPETPLQADYPLSIDLATYTISLPAASASLSGYLTSTDWSTFNGKQDTLTIGDITGTTNRAEVFGGTGAIIGSGVAIDVNTGLLPSPLTGDVGKSLVATGADTAEWQTSAASVNVSAPLALDTGTNTISIPIADYSTDGYLSAADYTSFANKQGAGSASLDGVSGRTTVSNGTGVLFGSDTVRVDIDQNLIPDPTIADAGKALVAGALGGNAAWETVSKVKITVSASAPSGMGAEGDLWFVVP